MELTKNLEWNDSGLLVPKVKYPNVMNGQIFKLEISKILLVILNLGNLSNWSSLTLNSTLTLIRTLFVPFHNIKWHV